MSRYTDRTIVVTGASEGIGRALCLALAPQRARLVMAARSHGRLEDLAAECERLGADPLARGKLARWLRLVAPGLLDRMAATAIPPRD